MVVRNTSELGPRQEGFSIRFANDGGPMIVIPRNMLMSWQGYRWLSDSGRGFEPQDPRSGTHYALACTAQGWVSVIPFDDGQIIVLGGGEELSNVRWVRRTT